MIFSFYIGKMMKLLEKYYEAVKCSFVTVFTILYNPIIPIKFGIAINPFMVSEILQIKSRLPMVPINTNAT